MYLKALEIQGKGVRDLVLCTLCPTCAGLLIERLRSQGIDYLLDVYKRQRR